MLLLVSTPLHILQVDTVTGDVKVIRSGDGYYYGVTCSEDQIVLSHSGGSLQYFSLKGHNVHTIKHLIQPHQLEWIDNCVVVTNTGKNRLSIFDNNGDFDKDVFLNRITWDNKDGERIGNHFNSVHKVNERLYVVAHNYDRNSEIYQLNWPELEVIKITTSVANWAHNYWSCEWGELICDSKNGSLYEMSSKNTVWSTNEENSITRGLAATASHVFVGSSENCGRKERPWTTGTIWILDRSSLRTIDKIVLPGSGEIREIRLIDAHDDCHNGYILTHNHISKIQRNSLFIDFMYKLRKKFPTLRRDIFPISIPVRAAQLLSR